MRRFVLVLVVFAVTATASNAYAWPRLFRRDAPASMRPAPAVAVQPQEGYRSFSYQPGSTPIYRSYRTAGRVTEPAFRDANSKALGHY